MTMDASCGKFGTWKELPIPTSSLDTLKIHLDTIPLWNWRTLSSDRKLKAQSHFTEAFISWQLMNLMKTEKNICHLGLTQNAANT